MGSVWAAFNKQLEAPVAVKFMSPNAVSSPDLVARFQREAKAAAQIRSPHVVQIFEHGVHVGLPYIVMELLEGEDLGKRLKRQGKLPLADAAEVLMQVCKALRRAHEMNIVHRDLKPANVFLARQGDDDDEVVKVLDFGIAKSLGSDNKAEDSTETGTLVGTPHYMSPEQAQRSKDIDARSDLWSLGVIAFRMLTGKVPFPGDDMINVLVNVCTAPIPVPSSLAPELTPAVDAFFTRAMSRDLWTRFQTAREFSDAVGALMGRRQAYSEVSLSPFSGPATSSLVSPQSIVATTPSPSVGPVPAPPSAARPLPPPSGAFAPPPATSTPLPPASGSFTPLPSSRGAVAVPHAPSVPPSGQPASGQPASGKPISTLPSAGVARAMSGAASGEPAFAVAVEAAPPLPPHAVEDPLTVPLGAAPNALGLDLPFAPADPLRPPAPFGQVDPSRPPNPFAGLPSMPPSSTSSTGSFGTITQAVTEAPIGNPFARQRRSGLVVVLGAAALLAFAIVIGVVMSGDPAPSAPASAAPSAPIPTAVTAAAPAESTPPAPAETAPPAVTATATATASAPAPTATVAPPAVSAHAAPPATPEARSSSAPKSSSPSVKPTAAPKSSGAIGGRPKF